ncbi:MAG: topoisomerase C-terminal repeat-containing protein [Clostridia bacterium]|nr:topoisomerase C-terminal repeat-containing protein [Clostridia bacterium]
MKLIIAEKPSLGRNIAAAIGNMKRCDGYLEGKDYIVSWAFGHLFSLADVEYYAPNPDGSNRWITETLPCIPQRFHFELRRGADGKVDSGVVKQANLLKTLCNRQDVDAIINAGDADREGEIIVRLCIQHALQGATAKKKILRLWLPDQTDETVRAALADMKDDREYDALANEGFARTYIDWLYGVNFTRYATLRMGSLLRVGRVIVPIVRAIYDRDMAIRNFKPEKYLALYSAEKTNGEVVELTSKRKFTVAERQKAEETCALYNQTGAHVVSVKNKKTTLFPGKLYSLSKLQSVLGKKYKMSMSDSLAIVQKLYEAGYLTYPRTNSEYLATAEKDKVKRVLSAIGKLGYPVTFRDSKSIFDDSKIESHSALTPTHKIPAPNALSEKEKQVYSTVLRRFVAVFCKEDCIAAKTEMKIAVGDLEEFVLRGTSILQAGWTKYDDGGQKDKILPKLAEGDKVEIAFAPTEKETSPPRHYTIETLNQYLKNPFKEEKAAQKEREESGELAEDDAEEYRAMFEGVELGTEATRTGIIDNARKSGYIELKKDVYTILPGGIFLIESLKDLRIGMDKYKTCEMGKALKKVFRGTMTVAESVALASEEINRVFKEAEKTATADIGYMGEAVGACPLCGQPVKRTSFGYGCSGYKDGCKFSAKMRILAHTVTLSDMKTLLETGKTPLIEDFISQKTGKSFSAYLKLEKDGKISFEFPPRGQRPPSNAPRMMEAPADEAPLPEEPPF